SNKTSSNSWKPLTRIPTPPPASRYTSGPSNNWSMTWHGCPWSKKLSPSYASQPLSALLITPKASSPLTIGLMSTLDNTSNYQSHELSRIFWQRNGHRVGAGEG